MASVYIKRNGPMVFWRLGRIGGSMYLANAKATDLEAKAARKAKRQAHMATLRYLAKRGRMAERIEALWLEQSRIARGGY